MTFRTWCNGRFAAFYMAPGASWEFMVWPAVTLSRNRSSAMRYRLSLTWGFWWVAVGWGGGDGPGPAVSTPALPPLDLGRIQRLLETTYRFLIHNVASPDGLALRERIYEHITLIDASRVQGAAGFCPRCHGLARPCTTDPIPHCVDCNSAHPCSNGKPKHSTTTCPVQNCTLPFGHSYTHAQPPAINTTAKRIHDRILNRLPRSAAITDTHRAIIEAIAAEMEGQQRPTSFPE